MIQKQKLKKCFGNEYNTFLFRFPGGSYGGVYNKIKKQIKTVLREKGIASLDWNALTGDAEGNKNKQMYNLRSLRIQEKVKQV